MGPDGRVKKLYKLPDNEYFEIDFTDDSMHPINCYLDRDYFKQYFDDVIIPLHVGRTEQ